MQVSQEGFSNKWQQGPITYVKSLKTSTKNAPPPLKI